MLWHDIHDVLAPPAPGSLMRAYSLEASGLWRLARRTCELYSVQILCAGAWGRIKVFNGQGRGLWHQPSTFTGSFWLSAEARDGLIVEMSSDEAPNITINWREPDMQVI